MVISEEKKKIASKTFIKESINYLKHSLEHLPVSKRVDVCLIISNLEEIYNNL